MARETICEPARRIKCAAEKMKLLDAEIAVLRKQYQEVCRHSCHLFLLSCKAAYDGADLAHAQGSQLQVTLELH